MNDSPIVATLQWALAALHRSSTVLEDTALSAANPFCPASIDSAPNNLPVPSYDVPKRALHQVLTKARRIVQRMFNLYLIHGDTRIAAMKVSPFPQFFRNSKKTGILKALCLWRALHSSMEGGTVFGLRERTSTSTLLTKGRGTKV